MENTYVPGVCNIGPAEIQMRVRVGWVGFGVTVVIAALLAWLGAPAWTGLVLFFPAFLASMGFLQGWMHFCVAFGAKGLFNMDKAVGQTDTVSQAEFRKADQKKVIQIWSYAVIISLVVALLGYFLL